MNNKTSGGGGEGTVHFRPVQRAGGGGGGGGGGGCAVHFRPVQRAGGAGCCPFSAGSMSGGRGWGGGGCCPRTTACEKIIKEGVATSKPIKLRAKKGFWTLGVVATPNPPPPPPPVSAPELSESVQTLPEFYLSLKYY